MVKLRVAEILRGKGKTNYWLYKQMGMSYQNFMKMLNNQTKSIHYSNIEALCVILARPDNLFLLADISTEVI